MSGRTYSVIAVSPAGQKRLVLVAGDALRAFDFVSDKVLKRDPRLIDKTKYCVYDGNGTLITQGQSRW